MQHSRPGGGEPVSQKKPVEFFVYHLDEFGDDDDHDDDGLSPASHMVAGAFAGVMEHICMFPVDTVKTRMQVLAANSPMYSGVTHALSSIVKHEGSAQLFRGASAVVMGAIPSHALYFATYEFAKHRLHADYAAGSGHLVTALKTGLSGALATCAHDAVGTPLDVVKQRMQLFQSSYSSAWQCARSVLAKEGLRAFYLSYPTTLLMNIPYTAAHFTGYEFFRRLLTPKSANGAEQKEGFVPWKHALAGGMAGAIAGFISNPMDVIKTRLQTQGVTGTNYSGLMDAARAIFKSEGWKGFLRGAKPRMMYLAPSAAICWVSYQGAKEGLVKLVGPAS